MGVLVRPGERRESPPPPLENENLEPEGDVNLDGDGEINESPPPPLLNENLALDGEVNDALLAAFVAGGDVNDPGAFAAIGFVCITSAELGERYSYKKLGDRIISPQVAASWLLFFFDVSGVPLFVEEVLPVGTAGDMRTLQMAAIKLPLLPL